MSDIKSVDKMALFEKAIEMLKGEIDADKIQATFLENHKFYLEAKFFIDRSRHLETVYYELKAIMSGNTTEKERIGIQFCRFS